MNSNWLEWLGYLASLIVLISLLMSSIIKLRWINLIGSSIFSLYGFLIGALPVGLMNLGIALINVYYLVKIYSAKESKEYFKILPAEESSQYLKYFLTYYQKEIDKYAGKTAFQINESKVSFFILRNMVPAGLFIASKKSDTILEVELDFVIPEYRDFKIGNYIYENRKDYFLEKGFTKFVSSSTNDEHTDYLKKIGFKQTADDGGKARFEKSIAPS
ncbi:inner membrane protein [Evansella caseinilytica]|uniref:Inner membrane protein n=1 Tax=Evansella caseinilytica TaxID=1503961 RepID=A0A1H3UPV6_9BACI|nr:YgjV family protein [Evansella caseinilytica]SDZ63749.1 inner membrane protein [Evansella caseinilytica]